MDDAKRLLAEGLSKGFAGETKFGVLERGSFRLSNSSLEGGEYNDAWVTGGGNELIRTQAGEVYCRSYTGDVIKEEELAKLGIDEEKVMDFLRSILSENAINTRFDQDFAHESADSDWSYSYKLTSRSEDPFIINGQELINYKGKTVFIHMLIISKVREQ